MPQLSPLKRPTGRFLPLIIGTGFLAISSFNQTTLPIQAAQYYLDKSYSLSPCSPACLNRQLFLTGQYPPISAPWIVSTALQLSDLPPGFQPAPSFLRQYLREGIGAVQPYLMRERISIANFSSFINLSHFEVVISVTANLSDPEAIRQFDASLQQPDTLDKLIVALQESTGTLGKLKVTQKSRLAVPDGIGDLATGYRLQASFEDSPVKLFVDGIVFRRDDSGVLLVVAALNHEVQTVQVGEIAAKLDRRL